MAKKAYIGVDGTARKVKKGYLGVGGYARRIKKAYIGIGGVARPCWSSGELAYYGVLENGLSVGGELMHAFSNSAYAIFGGNSQKILETYNASLTKTRAPDMTGYSGTTDYEYVLRANVDNYTILSYEVKASTSMSIDGVYTDAYDLSLVKTVGPAIIPGQHSMGVASLNDFAILAGGSRTASKVDVVSSAARVVNNSFTLTPITDLSLARQSIAGASIGNHAVFAGGDYGDPNTYAIQYVTTVDAYDTSLTKSNPTELQTKRLTNYKLSGVTFNGYALFYGSDSVEGYNSSLTHTIFEAHSIRGFNRPMTVVIGDYMLVSLRDYRTLEAIYSYDTSLTQLATRWSLSEARGNISVAKTGDYALYAGGTVGMTALTTVEAFTIN